MRTATDVRLDIEEVIRDIHIARAEALKTLQHYDAVLAKALRALEEARAVEALEAHI